MASRELRTIRIEDWLGNVYNPNGYTSVVESKGGGETINNSNIVSTDTTDKTGSDTDSNNTTSLTHVSDTGTSSGTSIAISGTTGAIANVATLIYENMPFGRYSVMLRMKSTANIKNRISSTEYTNIYSVVIWMRNTSTNYRTAVDNKLIRDVDFASADYCNIGFSFNYTGEYAAQSAMEVVIAKESTSAVVSGNLDYVVVNRAFTNVDPIIAGNGAQSSYGEDIGMLRADFKADSWIQNGDGTYTQIAQVLGNGKNPYGPINLGDYPAAVGYDRNGLLSTANKNSKKSYGFVDEWDTMNAETGSSMPRLKAICANKCPTTDFRVDILVQFSPTQIIMP